MSKNCKCGFTFIFRLWSSHSYTNQNAIRKKNCLGPCPTLKVYGANLTQRSPNKHHHKINLTPFHNSSWNWPTNHSLTYRLSLNLWPTIGTMAIMGIAASARLPTTNWPENLTGKPQLQYTTSDNITKIL